MARGPELQLDLRSLRGTLDAQRERGPKVGDRLFERERRHGRTRRSQAVEDRSLRVAKRRPCGEMVRDVREPPARDCAEALLEGGPDLKMQLGTTQGAQPIVERPPHQLVREAVPERSGRDLLDHSAAHRFVESLEQASLVEPGRAPHHIEPEFGPGDSSYLENLGGRRRQPGQSLADHLADAVRARERRKRLSEPRGAIHYLKGTGFPQRAPQLGHEKRVSVG